VARADKKSPDNQTLSARQDAISLVFGETGKLQSELLGSVCDARHDQTLHHCMCNSRSLSYRNICPSKPGLRRQVLWPAKQHAAAAGISRKCDLCQLEHCAAASAYRGPVRCGLREFLRRRALKLPAQCWHFHIQTHPCTLSLLDKGLRRAVVIPV
jgi:hypothetical protein